MEKYYCFCCNYKTEKINHMNKHVMTHKHIVASKSYGKTPLTKKIKIYECSMCGDEYIDYRKKWRHEKICNKSCNTKICNKNGTSEVAKQKEPEDVPTKNPRNKYEHIIANKDRELGDAKQQINEYKALVDKLVSSTVNMSQATSKTADVANKSMSVLKYASLHMTDAPPLEELCKEEVYGILNYKGNDKKLNKAQQEDENEIYVKMVIGHYINKNLVNVLGDTIVQYFRKPGEDFKKTSSIWAVDVARLSFIIMHAISKDGEKEWKDDKTGKSFKSMVIRPMLTTLNEILHNFIEYKEDWLERNKDATVEEMGKIMNLRQKSAELMKDITYRQLEQPLLKSVAPSFKFDDYLKKK
jgi:hypothetical protein